MAKPVRAPFGLAGIWENWSSPTTGERERNIKSCAVPRGRKAQVMSSKMQDAKAVEGYRCCQTVGITPASASQYDRQARHTSKPE
jgi:hypothetical protein